MISGNQSDSDTDSDSNAEISYVLHNICMYRIIRFCRCKLIQANLDYGPLNVFVCCPLWPIYPVHCDTRYKRIFHKESHTVPFSALTLLGRQRQRRLA